MKQATDLSSLPQIDGARIAILQASWHKQYSDSMVVKCVELLKDKGADEPQVHLLPGSLELPAAAKTLLKEDASLEALVAFGIIIQGDTDHYQMVRDACLHGLLRVSLDENKPVINQVLAARNEEQIAARSADDGFNKGLEAAAAAIQMIAWRRNLS